MTSIFNKAMITTGLLAIMITPSVAAIEIDEDNFGPSYETMVVDTVVAKPLQVVAAIAGTAAYIVSIPFSVIGGNYAEAQETLLLEPWNALSRCLGCTVAEDNFYKAQSSNNHQVRIMVDQASEIIINTDDNVIVMPQ